MNQFRRIEFLLQQCFLRKTFSQTERRYQFQCLGRTYPLDFPKLIHGATAQLREGTCICSEVRERPLSRSFHAAPVRSRIAINSGLVSASGPRASNFSRGRSSLRHLADLQLRHIRIWRAEFQRRRQGLARLRSATAWQAGARPSIKASDAKLIKHLTQRITEEEQRLGVRIGSHSIQPALRLSNQIAAGHN